MPGNTEWTILTLKEHLERLIHERDLALESAQVAINKADSRLDSILEHFPQEFGHKSDYESLLEQVNIIRADHVQRREFEGLKNEQLQSRGTKIALSATSGIVLALIGVSLGTMYANQLSHRDVSQQISVESPWLADKPGIEESIHLLEQQVVLLKTQLASHEATDRIRAATRK